MHHPSSTTAHELFRFCARCAGLTGASLGWIRVGVLLLVSLISSSPPSRRLGVGDLTIFTPSGLTLALRSPPRSPPAPGPRLVCSGRRSWRCWREMLICRAMLTSTALCNAASVSSSSLDGLVTCVCVVAEEAAEGERPRRPLVVDDADTD